MKKTLVIHPNDRSTDFLCRVYKDKDFDVIRHFEKISREGLKKLIAKYDRIIMMGHGTPSGLINTCGGRYAYLIDDEFADLLKTKNTISIWCHSDQYFLRNKCGHHELHTGMIISEVLESLWVLGMSPFDEAEMLENMNMFADCLNQCIDLTPEETKEYMLEHYVGSDPITAYNRSNIKLV